MRGNCSFGGIQIKGCIIRCIPLSIQSLLFLSVINLLFAGDLRLGGRNYRNVASVSATLLEAYDTIYQCVESVVATHTDVFTRIVNCTSLTYNDVTSFALLSTPNLHTKSLTC